MSTHTASEWLWGKNAKVSYLMTAAFLMLLTSLGGRELWTQEHRWADIVSAMFYYHDFLHPMLNGQEYYDKPLLSYWLMAAFSKLLGGLSTWALRLPSALAGVLAVWSIYRLGSILQSKQLGLLAGWMLLTTFYFIFWARTSNADILNFAGTLFGVYWYFATKTRANLFGYTIFFLILAVTALCKGLVGPIVTLLAILPDLLRQKEWKKHLNISLLLGLIPAAIIYIVPFWASVHFSAAHYNENGLYLVYRENILRYFQPFDHQGAIYTYLVYLPLYLFPWVLFFIPTLFSIKSRLKTLSLHSQWMMIVLLILFIFFTLSGSRRSYYVLPMVPFALLMTADWILLNANRAIWAGRMAIVFFIVFFLYFAVMQPFYYRTSGVAPFANEVKQKAAVIKPLSEWNIVLLDAESKVRFYLQVPPIAKNYGVVGERQHQTPEMLRQSWPMLNHLDTNTIYISRKEYESVLSIILHDYDIIVAKPGWGERLFRIGNPNLSIAFIPKKIIL